jgi:hypothetical protein
MADSLLQRFLALAIATGALASCATHLSPEVRRRAAATPILTTEQVGARRFAILGELVGRSCVREPGTDPSIEIAREELKVGAAALEADAVTSALCRAGGVDVTHNCVKSIECRADAIRWGAT